MQYKKSSPTQMGGKSRTQQSMSERCNMNTIIARYRQTGILGSPDALSRRQGVFADVSNIPDYPEMCQRIANAQEAFQQLPARVRFRFRNDPAQLIDFIQDERNREEAIELGLVKPPEPKIEPEAPKTSTPT